MKVYFIGGSYESCHYVRCLIPLVAGGWDGDKTSLRQPKRGAQEMMRGAMASDIVVFHRPIQKEMYDAAMLLKQAGKKIVMDNDDTYSANSGVPVQMFGKQRDLLDKAINKIDIALKKFATIADMVTVTTEFLKKEYEQVNPNVHVLPNCVDTMDWDTPAKNDTGKIRLGIVGSVASNQDYKNIIPLLDKLKERNDVQIVLLALPAKSPSLVEARKMYEPEIKFWEKYDVEWHPFMNQSDYIPFINDLKIDIMLIPRDDNYFNRCKSNLKFLEASMCGMATVAQSFPDNKSPYEVDKEDAKNLILATDSQDWIKKVTQLLDNPTELAILKEKASKYVKEKYNIDNNINKWIEAYKTLI